MTQGRPSSPSRAAPLNEYQARRLRVTCQHIDKLLCDIEAILHATSSKAVFRRFSQDVAPAQQRAIEDHIARLRAQLTRVLERHGLAPEQPAITASHAIRVIVGAIDISIEELKPQHMRGYGELTETAAKSLNDVVGELRVLASGLERYLADARQDVGDRLER